MINRAAILIKYKDPAIKWINEFDPIEDGPEITKESVNQDSTVYLISHIDADTPENLKLWISANYRPLFQTELEGWYTDESVWPKMNLSRFNNWFDVECYPVVIDTVGTPIEDDDDE